MLTYKALLNCDFETFRQCYDELALPRDIATDNVERERLKDGISAIGAWLSFHASLETRHTDEPVIRDALERKL